jgi:ABC-type spermidine/putrescine transport system permease subunit I
MSAADLLTQPSTPSRRAPRPEQESRGCRLLRHRGALLAVPALAFLLLIFVLPFLAVVRVSAAGAPLPGSGRFFDLGVVDPGALGAVASDPLFGSVLGVTLRLGLIVTVVCMAIAVPFAAYVHRARGWRRGVLLGAVVLPKLVNLLVLLYGVLLILGNRGFLNRGLLAAGLIDAPLPLFGNLFAVVFTEVLVVLPYPLLLLVAAFSGADPRQHDAARSLGAGPVRAYWETVIAPARHAIVGAALITAVWAVGAFVGPLVLGNPVHYTVAVEVYERALVRLAWVDAAGWAVLGVAACGAVLALLAVVSRRWAR